MTTPTDTPKRGASRLHAAEVVVRRADRLVLDHVTVTAEPGAVLAVTGPSGAGKSTLLALFAGLSTPDQGQILIGGRPLLAGDDTYLRRLGLILQGYGLISYLTVAENVELVLRSRGVTAVERTTRTTAALHRVGLAGQADQLTEQISGGQQQRVAIARALVDDPDVIIADEPTAELDVDTRDAMTQLLRHEADRGATVIIATHDPDIAAAADAKVRLEDGRNAPDGNYR